MIVKRNKDLAESFRKRRRTTEETKTTAPRRQPRNVGNSPYDSFKYKYNHLEEFIDNFGTRDFVYYFREVSEECGFRYTVSNIKKDMAIFKRLRENYDPREICGMIEFLFRSEQDYLDKDRLSPNLLASQWVNTIYADTQLWLDDKYVNKYDLIKIPSIKKRTYYDSDYSVLITWAMNKYRKHWEELNGKYNILE